MPKAEIQSQPLIAASYIATFLKPEMQHIHRQICSLSRWRALVLCQKRENAATFPYEPLRIFQKPRSHPLRRLFQKTLLGRPITIYGSEARTLRAQIEASGALLLHVYFGHIGIHLLPLLEICPVPVLVSFHGADSSVEMDRPKHRAAMLRVFILARHILVRSSSLAAKLVEAGCPSEKIRLNRTGIPLDAASFRERRVPGDGAWHCVQASRLIEKKGLFTSLAAFSKFAAQWPKATLTIAGEGPLQSPLQKRIFDLGLAGRVRFTGFLSQPELSALLDRADFFLHPSETGGNGDQEGVPNAVLEAMAMGLPVFATHHGGIPEAIEHGVSGILVPEKDAMQLALEMCKLATEADRFSAISATAAQKVAAAFDIRSTAAALEKIYDEAIRKTP